MTTHTVSITGYTEVLPEKDIIAGHQKRIEEYKKSEFSMRSNEGINSCPVVFKFEVSI